MPLIIDIVTKLINKSLTEGAFSKHWKTAIICPLLKKPGTELIGSNYRLVRNLPFLSKVVEKIALTRFNKHRDKYQLMPGYQSAYRKNFSCETAIIKITSDILWSMELKKITSLTCIDLSAAFDTVDHGILLNVLQNKFGISGNALSWFKSYLQPRFCRVNIHNANLEDKEMLFLVPQGSCVGPVLYSAYASTLQEVVPLDLHGYANDHGLKTNFTSVPECEAKAIADTEKCLTDIKTWMDHNRLHMNYAKTEFILFGSRQQLQKCTTKSLSANGEEISHSNCSKYLGTWMDQVLSFRQHIINKCRVAMLNIQQIKLIRNILNEDTTHTLVLSLIMSHLDYCNAIFYGLPEVDLKRLQRVQNVAAKLVPKQILQGQCHPRHVSSTLVTNQIKNRIQDIGIDS